MSLPQLVHAVREAVNRDAVKRDRFIRLADVLGITGIKKSLLYALMADGLFPQSIRITARCVVWSEQAVLQWVQDRLTAAGQATPPETGGAQ
jgi:prophage regulatory protein